MSIFSSFRSALQTETEKLLALRRSIAEIDQQRARILHAPAHRSDLKAMARRWVKECGDKARTDVVATLQPFFRQPHTTRPNGHGRSAPFSLFGLPDSALGSSVAVAQLDQLLCRLVPQQVLAELDAAIDSLPAPDDVLPIDDRQAAVEKLDAKRSELAAKVAAMEAEFSAAGLPIPD